MSDQQEAQGPDMLQGSEKEAPLQHAAGVDRGSGKAAAAGAPEEPESEAAAARTGKAPATDAACADSQAAGGAGEEAAHGGSGKAEHHFGHDAPSQGIDRGIDKLEGRRALKADDRASGNLKGQKARGWTEKVLTRTTSGAIYSIGTLICLIWGTIPTAILLMAEAWLCCSEFYRMGRMAGRMPNELIGLTVAVLFPLSALFPQPEVTVALISIMLLVACAVWFVITPRANLADVSLTAFGPIYTSFAFACIVIVRGCDPGLDGFLLTFGLMGSIWLEDAAAYFVGSRFGVHKLAPRISPHKSVEGFWGGVAGCVLVWVLLWALGVRGMSLPLALVCGVAVSITAVVGDLFESRIKRGVGVKDSGNIMPGHGGLLDRSDSMLFGGMAAFFVLYLGGIL